MHGDFSLNPQAYRDHVSRVLYQQGRVQLDSDFNELTESMLRAMRGAASDIIGPHGGVGDSFEILPPGVVPGDFLISWGEYYVDGIRCVNLPRGDWWDLLARPPQPPVEAGLPYREQPWIIRREKEKKGKKEKPDEREDDRAPGLFYLDVFEHSISSAQDDSLRESALLGADTTSRAIVVWQVRKLTEEETSDWRKLTVTPPPHVPVPRYDKEYLTLNLFLRSSGRLAARATITETTDPCVISPDARYRGLDNRLFRVEVHRPGRMKNGKLQKEPTFKFSRDNGAEVYPVLEISGKVVQLESLGRDHRTAIRVNDWVEVVDDEVLLMNKVHPLLQVVDVNRHDMTVTLNEEPEDNAGSNQKLRPMLRRWDGPPIPIRLRDPGKPKAHWIDLADGIQVQFSYEEGFHGGFRAGDYWLIPARTATGDVVWPRDENEDPLPRGPHGVDHHYAPLAVWNGGGFGDIFRRSFDTLTMVKPG